jgi:hypothetical protein
MLKQPQWWNTDQEWKHLLNHLRLIMQLSIASGVLSRWLDVFHLPSLRKSLGQLVTFMQGFQSYVPI